MKKATLEAVRNYLNGEDVDLTVLRQEINDEWERTTAKARENAELYATAMPIVEKTLSETPMTARQIHVACYKELPEGFTANKVRYLLLHQLADKVEKHPNGKNANTYTRKKKI